MPKLSPDGLEKGPQWRKFHAKGPTIVNKLPLTTIVVAGLACLAPGAAQADLIWSLEAPPCPVCFTFADDGQSPGNHGTGAGTFSTFDTTITVWNLKTTTTSSFDGVTYLCEHCDDEMAQTADLKSLFFTENNADLSTNVLRIDFLNPLGSVGPFEDPVEGADEILVKNDMIVNERSCASDCGGAATLVIVPPVLPEPSTASVLGAGLLGLVFLWHRRRQGAGAVDDSR
jgi:hypothetical protein